MKKRINIELYLFLFIILFSAFVSAGTFDKLLSPFFPDFSPFNVSITLLRASAPIINITNEIFICEGNRTSYFFNVSDADGDSLSVDITPKDPFFISPIRTSAGDIKTQIELFSGILAKSRVGLYQESISASDGALSDLKRLNITVVEKNNAPVITPIGVQTVWTKGDDSVFYHQVIVNDVEDGNQNSGNMIINITNFVPRRLFNMTQNGIMNYTGNESDIGVYNISVCATDRGILNPHAKIVEVCNQDGRAIMACFNFSLTVTNENRRPIITSQYPINLSFNALGERKLYFNITKHDPDGTIPDAYWYVDSIFRQYNSGNLSDEFSYTFGCGVSGPHNVRVEITDGLLNSSLQWNVSVGFVSCPAQPVTGGGGGGGLIGCIEKWGCGEWNMCLSADPSFESGLISSKDFKIIKDNCALDSISNDCGVQFKDCIDINSCNTTKQEPVSFSHCFYVPNPSCNDNVKNCHDEGCEVLTDCGGPCEACPTCSDGIKNQGEQDIDCGGPCTAVCPPKLSLAFILRFQFWLLLLILLIAIIIIIYLIKIYREGRRFRKQGF